MNLQDHLSKKSKAPKGKAGKWLPFCKLDVPTGSLWAGDPHLANADDGCVVKVPVGRYVVEGVGAANGRYRVVSRLRVRLEGAKDVKPGKEVGETGTDSAMIGVCDIKAFDKACGPDAGEDVQEAIEAQTRKSYGVVNLKKFPGAIMPFVPTGSDGGGPVLALMSGRKRVGIELSFTGEDDDGDASAAPRRVSLIGIDRGDFIARLMADGTEASFWLGGEEKAGEEFSIWTSAKSGPIHYRIRKGGKSVVKDWTPIKQKGRGPFSANETLGAGRYEIDIRVGKEIHSALKISPA